MVDKIDPPNRDRRRAGIRGVFEAIAQVHPATAALTRIYQETHPPKAVAEREAWEEKITEKVNEHDADLQRQGEALDEETVTFSGVDADLIEALAKACPDGLGDPNFTVSDAEKLVPAASSEEFEQAVYKLKSVGLIDVIERMGPSIIRLNQGFYEVIDQDVMGWETAADGAHLAALVLEGDGASSPDLEERTGWTPRRLNPALRWLADRLPAGHACGTGNPRYHFQWIMAEPETKVYLQMVLDDRGQEVKKDVDE